MYAITDWLQQRFTTEVPTIERLVALGVSDTEIALQWRCNQHGSSQVQDQYRVYMKESAEDDDIPWDEVLATAGQRALITTCLPDQEYTLKVAATVNNTVCMGITKCLTRPKPSWNPAFAQYLYPALIAAGAAYDTDPEAYLGATGRLHALTVQHQADDFVVFKDMETAVHYVAFRGPADPLGVGTPPVHAVESLVAKDWEKGTTAFFVGWDNGGVQALRTFNALMAFVTQSTGAQQLACITFGAPLPWVLECPEALGHKHLVHHVVVHRDPVTLTGLTSDVWQNEFIDVLKQCRCQGRYLMDVHGGENMWGCKDQMLNGLLLRQSESVLAQAQQPTHGPMVLGSVTVLQSDQSFSVHRMCTPPLEVADMERHAMLHYDGAVLPPGSATHAGALTPHIDEAQVRIIGHAVELCVLGRNLSYATKVVVRCAAWGEREVCLDMVHVQMHTLTSVTDIVTLGLIEDNHELSLEVQSPFGFAACDQLKKLEEYELSYVPRRSVKFAEMKEPERLLATAVKLSLLTNEEGPTEPRLRAHIKALEQVLPVFEQHTANWLKRYTTKVGTTCDVQDINYGHEGMLGELYEHTDDETTERKVFSVLSEVASALEPTLLLSLHSASAGTDWAVFLGKCTLAVGGFTIVAANPALGLAAFEGMAALGQATALTTVPHFSDVLSHTARIASTYDQKVTFVARMLLKKDTVLPLSLFCREQLVHARLQELKLSDGAMYDLAQFAEVVKAQWDELAGQSESPVMEYCAEKDAFISLAWAVYHMFEVRKVVTSTFLVQVFGPSNAGKTTVVQNVFGVEGVQPGCSIADTTTRMSGHKVAGCAPLLVVDNPGIQDTFGRGEGVIDSAAYYLLTVNWDSGLRNAAFVARLAMVMSLGKPFKVLLTKADTMVTEAAVSKKERNREWLRGHVDGLNKVLEECRGYVVDKQSSINDDLRACIDGMLETLDDPDKPGVDMIRGVVQESDFIMCSVHAIEDVEMSDRRKTDCETRLGVVLVEGVREVLAATWEETYDFKCGLRDLEDLQLPEEGDVQQSEEIPL